MSNDADLMQRLLSRQKELLSSLQLKDVLQAAVNLLSDMADGAKVAILLADNESLALKLMASCNYSEQSVEQLKVLEFSADSLLKTVVQKRIAQYAATVLDAPNISAQVMQRELSRGQLGLPLISTNLLVGAALIDFITPTAADRRALIEEIGKVTAAAIANAILFGRSEYERERLNTLYKTSCALSGSALRVSEVFQIAADTALVLANAGGCAVLLFDPDNNSFSLAAFKGLDKLDEFDITSEMSLAHRCLSKGKTEYILNSERAEGLPKLAGGGEIGSLVALPIAHDSKPLAVLMVFSSDERGFHREQIELIESLAAQVAVALTVALTHESTASQTMQDAHTGLYTRWHFDEALQREIERSQRHKRELALVLLDVDHLSEINDHLGQEKGDEAIRHVARIIKNALRDIDVPCRYGGEEFAIILPETNLKNASEVAERLRQKIRSEPAAGIGMVTVSIGMSAFPSNAESAQDLILAAEQALDIAKFEGRDRLQLAQCGKFAVPSGPIAWDELARQAKLAVISQRQSQLESRLAAATPAYAQWMRSSTAWGAKKKDAE